MYSLDELIEHTQDLTLLYVEDNKDTRESTIIILEHLFDHIIVAIDGEDGLEKYKENPQIDLILSDISMPNMNGLEMSKRIKEINKDQSIIILSAITEIDIIKKAIDIGIDSFISKPLQNIEILFEKIEKSIKEIQYEKQQKELIVAKQNKEKIEMIMKLIQNLSHHWRQPLSVISSIASSCSFKIENNIDFINKDYNNIGLITKKTKELSSIFEQLEVLDFEKVTIKDIEDIIYTSNPIQRDK